MYRKYDRTPVFYLSPDDELIYADGLYGDGCDYSVGEGETVIIDGVKYIVDEFIQYPKENYVEVILK